MAWHRAVPLSYFFIIFCCVIGAFANIYAWKALLWMCLYWERGGPVEIFAPPPPIPVMVMCIMFSCDEQAD